MAAAVPMAGSAEADQEACVAFLAPHGHVGDVFEQGCAEGETGDLEGCWITLFEAGVEEAVAVEACVLAAAGGPSSA
ncbi:hypothetical protein GCM10010171_27560 [Actinokineospora fastidiosa]|uniref:Uncharacterized protein n=1 Tax=Actinokineospora fastidiosa TaxID=1816 RepID=A0A918LCQ1_9PSEU|nr:hypothetical protein GCM10010171_27560 [Actinokineospora fastidiosa]